MLIDVQLAYCSVSTVSGAGVLYSMRRLCPNDRNTICLSVCDEIYSIALAGRPKRGRCFRSVRPTRQSVRSVLPISRDVGRPWV